MQRNYDNTMKWMFQVLKGFDGDLFEVMNDTEVRCEEARTVFIEKGAIISDTIEVDDNYEPFVGFDNVRV